MPYVPTIRQIRRAALGTTLVLLVTGCSILESDTIDYKSASRGTTLEVPPDLTQLQDRSRYVVPGESVTASGYAATQATNSAVAGTTAPNTIADVHFMRGEDGTRWLRVDRAPDKVWGQLRDFWLENGFLLTVDQPTTGVMETDWAENRAKIPQDIIRRTIGKAFDSLYSTGERDMFRTRVERNAAGGTDIFITHRGMQEVYTTTTQETTVWQPRKADPGLEAEFLRRMMVKLGVSEEQSRSILQAQAAGQIRPAQAVIVTSDTGAPALRLDEDFDRAWRRVGLALDRTGFTVEDRDRSEGVYFVRYVDPTIQKQKPGFFAKLFGRGSQPIPTERYRVLVRTIDGGALITVADSNGASAAHADAQRIVQVLADELK